MITRLRSRAARQIVSQGRLTGRLTGLVIGLGRLTGLVIGLGHLMDLLVPLHDDRHIARPVDLLGGRLRGRLEGRLTGRLMALLIVRLGFSS